ncbi:Nramp family divalent metal transporter [Micromonospora sp. M12]
MFGGHQRIDDVEGDSTTGRSRPGPVRGRLILLGPAFVAAVAYVDPGNFATNSAAGARYGYLLVWVVVVANLMAMLVQTLTAKLGLATGRSLPELCRERLPRPVNRVMWVQAELVAMATDLAEVIGGAVALYLLFGIPCCPAGSSSAPPRSPCSPCARAATAPSRSSSPYCSV